MNRILFLLFALPISGVAQNTCGSAAVITPGIHTTGVIDGTNGTGQNNCWGSTPQVAVHAEWYAYTATADGLVTVDTDFSLNDGVTLSNNIRVSVYGGTCGSLVCIGTDGSIWGTPPYKASITFQVRQGKTYFITFDDFYSDKPLQFELALTVPQCDNTVPFAESWQNLLGFMCWKTYGGDNYQKWVYHPSMNLDPDPQRDPVAVSYPAFSGNKPKNEWLVSPGLNFESGKHYTISVKYNALNFAGDPNETFRTVMLTTNDPDIATENELGIVAGIIQQGAYVPPYNGDLATTVNYDFSPAVTGNYYIGLHSISPATGGALVIYEVKAEETLGSARFENNAFSIYPNPSSGLVTIQGNGNAVISHITITDLNGRIVYTKPVAEANPTIDIVTVTSGIYILSVTHDRGVFTKRIIKG